MPFSFYFMHDFLNKYQRNDCQICTQQSSEHALEVEQNSLNSLIPLLSFAKSLQFYLRCQPGYELQGSDSSSAPRHCMEQQIQGQICRYNERNWVCKHSYFYPFGEAMLGYLHNNEETETCFDIVETSPAASHQKPISMALKQENIFLVEEPL